jgi:DNA polymerase
VGYEVDSVRRLTRCGGGGGSRLPTLRTLPDADERRPGRRGPHERRSSSSGEGPGWNEDKQGKPFVGPAGKFLDELLTIAGVSREDVFITNVVKCRPPGNRDPLPDEIAACAPYLDRQIAMIDPEVVVTLGRFSMARWFPGERHLEDPRQSEARRQTADRADVPPAAALHQQALRGLIEADFAKLPRSSRTPSATSRRRRSPTRRTPRPTDETLLIQPPV